MFEKEIAFCTEKVGKEGSSLYYALLFQQPKDKAFWLGCFTLSYEIKRAAMLQFEAGLAQVKLGWWRNALLDCRSKQAQHPVILAIGPDVINALPDEHWGDLINQVVESTDIKRNQTDLLALQSVLASVRPWGAVLGSWFGVRSGTGSLDTQSNSNSGTGASATQNLQDQSTVDTLLLFWARSLQLTQLLRLAKYLDDGFQPLPIDWLQAHEVTAEQLKKREHSPATQALFKESGEFLIREANKHWKSLPTEVQLHCRPLRALFRMREAEFKMHAASGYLLLNEQKILSPWKKFSTAWTTQVLRK